MSILTLLCQPWAILPSAGDLVWDVYNKWSNGETIDIAALEAARGAPLPGPQRVVHENRDGIVIITASGVLSQRINLMQDVSGGTSTELLARDIQAAADDKKISGILLKIDSPGGQVSGTQAAAAALYRARQIKPTATLVDEQAASGGVWIASAAKRVFMASPTAVAGHIGVAMRHVDTSEAQREAGIKTTHIYAGRYKRIDNPDEPLTDEAKKYLQKQVDYLYSLFVNDMARNRGVSTDRVLSDMADARLFYGQQAVDVGLADGIASEEEVLAMLRQQVAGGASANVLRRVRIDGTTAVNGPPLAVISTLPVPMEPSQVAQWATDNPQAAAALRAEGAANERQTFASELAEAVTAARAEGAAAEAARASSVLAVGRDWPGHRALVEALAGDGHTTAEQTAMAILAAEASLRAGVQKELAASATAPVPFSPTPGVEQIAKPLDPEHVHQRATALADRTKEIMSNKPGITHLQAFKIAQSELSGDVS